MSSAPTRADTWMTFTTQTSDYESDNGEDSYRHTDSPVVPMQEIEHVATAVEVEAPHTATSERKGSLSLTFNHLRAHDEVGNHSPDQQLRRSDSTAVTVSSEVPGDSPITPTEPIAESLHESPVDISADISPTIEEPVTQRDEPTVVAHSPPYTPPTASKEQDTFRSPAPLQNGVPEVARTSSSEYSANEGSAPDAQPEPDTLEVPSNSDTTELTSPVESEVFVYPDSSPPELVPATTMEPESPEDDTFRYPTAEPVEPTPTEPVEPVAPAPRRPIRDRHTDLEDTPPRDPTPTYHRPHSPHFNVSGSTVRSQRYSLTEDKLPAPEVFGPVAPVPIRASALASARTVTRDPFIPSRVDSNDYSRYSPRPRQTGSPAQSSTASVTVEDANDASSDLGDASATGALGDARKKRRRKKNNKTNRRSVVFSDDEPEVIGSASDWAMESGEESGEASAAVVNQFDQRFSRQGSLPPVSSPLARSAMPLMRGDSEFSAGSERIEVLSPTSSVDSRGPILSYRELHSPGSSRAASPSPSVGSVGSVGSNADGDWSARKVDAYGRWYQAMNKHQPVRAVLIARRFSRDVAYPISRSRRFRG